MSHTVTIKTQFKDAACIGSAAKELRLEVLPDGEHELYAGKVRGIAVKLPGWSYPVVIDTKTGEAKFDNYNGRWGAQSELDRFTQMYAVHKATAAAKAKGYLVTRKAKADGTLQLVVTGM